MSGSRLVFVAALTALLVGTAAGRSGAGATRIAVAPFATVFAQQTEEANAAVGGATVSPTTAPLDDVAIPLGGSLEIARYAFFDDEYGNVQMLGELRNVGGEAVANPKARFILYDEGGNVIDTLDASSVLPVVEPGDLIPVRGFVNDVQSAEWVTEEAYLCQGYDDPTEFAVEGLELQDVEEQSHEEDRLEIEGQVYNGNAMPIGGVTVIALVYQDGRFVGSGRAPLQYEIPAERSGRFELSAYGTDLIGVDGDEYTYDLWAGVTPDVTFHTC